MAEEKEQKYRKPKVICPFCQERQPNGNFRAFAVNGMSMHVRMQHPEKYDEYQTHREKYIAKFACDDDGVIIGSTTIVKPIPEPIVEEEVISEPEEPSKFVKVGEHISTQEDTVVIRHEEDNIPAKKITIKPEPKVPKKEEFPDDKEPERYEYNPYGY